MFSIVKTLRRCRSVHHLPELYEKFTYLRTSYQLSGLKRKPNFHRFYEVMPKRLFSTESNRNKDPLSDCDAIFPLNKIQVEELTGNDPQEIKKLRILQMELAVKSVQYPNSMPAKIRLEQWMNLLNLSRSAQLKYLAIIKKKEERYVGKKVQEDEPAEFDPSDHEHGIFEHKLFRNALFPMLHPNTISAAMNSRLATALLFSPTLIMDCSYESIMEVREIKNLCQQLALCINLNRSSRKPYNITFCNLKKDSLMGNSLWSAVPIIYEDQMPIVSTESCYTKLYPKERLVYLTPHCRNSVQFDPEDIYIVGAMVDKSNPGPHSLIKAKTEGIRMGSFPLDKYLVWKKGTKSLTLDQVIMIMLTMLQTRDWSKSFEAIPKRKIADIMSYRGFDKRQRKFEF